MLPAFRSVRDAAAFAGIVGFFLLSPVILKVIGPSSREEVWKAVSYRAGPTEYAAAATYQDKNDPDIVFVGSSLVLDGILPDQIQRDVGKLIGRPVTCRVIGISWGTLDIQYILLHDYLERHHPKLVVIGDPTFNTQTGVYYEMYSWMRYGEFSDDVRNFPRSAKVQLYGEEVIGAPRQFLSLFRPNLTYATSVPDFEDTDYVRKYRNIGWLGGPFHPEDPRAPAPPPAKVFDTSTLLSLNPKPTSLDWQATPYTEYFLKRIVSIVRENGSKLVWLHVPTIEEFGRTDVPLSKDWARLAGSDPKVIAIPDALLFPGMDLPQVHNDYFEFLHMNRNGAIRFSSAICPPLAQELSSSERVVTDSSSNKEHGLG